MKTRVLFAFIVAAALTTSIASAQTIEATPIPRPAKPDFTSMKFLVGTWSCTTKSSRRPSPTAVSIATTLDPNGYWLVQKWSSEAVSWFPYPSTGQDLITYDADTGRWIDAESDSLGGYDLSTSKGWDGNHMTWHDLAFARGKDIVSVTELTNTKDSETKISSVSGFTTKAGKSVHVATSCTKK